MMKLMKELAESYNLNFTNKNGVVAVSDPKNTIRKTKKGVRWIADVPGGDDMTIMNMMSQLSPGKKVMATLIDGIERNKVYSHTESPRLSTFPVPEDFIHEECAPIKLTMVFADPGMNIHIGESHDPVISLPLRQSPGARNISDMLTYTINKYMETVLNMQVQGAEAKPLMSIRKGRYMHICVYIMLLEDGASYGGEGDWIQFDEFDVSKFRGITSIVMEEFFQAIRPMSQEEFEQHQKDVEDAYEATEKDIKALQDE